MRDGVHRGGMPARARTHQVDGIRRARHRILEKGMGQLCRGARKARKGNAVTAEIVKGRVAPGELILADLSDEKACADYRSYGLRCWPARKGPGSRELGVRWLQGLNAIVIDPVKCPCVLQEFLEWEYEVAPDGTVLGTLMDARDHGIDAARYACSRIWQRKGA